MLKPVDFNRCECEKQEGGFMTLGPVQWVRCQNKAFFIVKEIEPGSDGLYGRMSLCQECFEKIKVLRPNQLHYIPIRLIEMKCKNITLADFYQRVKNFNIKCESKSGEWKLELSRGNEVFTYNDHSLEQLAMRIFVDFYLKE